MLTNTRLEDEVIASLEQDPRIPDATEIAVSADGGRITLRGTVESFGQRRAVLQDGRKIDGVYEIDDQLKVSLSGADRREDHEIRGAALQTLIWDTEVPSDSVDVRIQDGWATLTGDVAHQFHSDAAYDDIARLYGVRGITNKIRVTNPSR